jgi:hypothetical protein
MTGRALKSVLTMASGSTISVRGTISLCPSKAYSVRVTINPVPSNQGRYTSALAYESPTRFEETRAPGCGRPDPREPEGRRAPRIDDRQGGRYLGTPQSSAVAQSVEHWASRRPH